MSEDDDISMERGPNGVCLVENLLNISTFFRVYYIIYVIFVVVIVIGSLVLWGIKRSSLIYLRKRSYSAAMINGIGQLISLFAGPFTLLFKSNNNIATWCTVFNTAFATTPPLLITTAVLTALSFRNNANLTKSLIRSTELYEGKPVQITNRTWYLASEKFSIVLFFITLSFTIGFTTLISFQFCPQSFGNENEKGKCRTLSIKDLTIVFIFTIYLIIGCLVVFYIRYKLKTFPDPFKILINLRKGLSFSFLGIIPIIILIGLNPGNIDEIDEEKQEIFFTYGVLIDIPIFFFFLYLVPYEIFNGYKFNQTEEIYLNKTLEEILNDSDGYELLKQFLISEFNLKNLLFLENIKTLDKLNSYDEINEKILFIYEKFIKHERLYLSDETYKLIENTIKQNENNQISIENYKNIYIKAYNETKAKIEKQSFNRFKETEEFRVYMGVEPQKQSTFESEIE